MPGHLDYISMPALMLLPEVTRLPSRESKRRTLVSELLAFAFEPK